MTVLASPHRARQGACHAASLLRPSVLAALLGVALGALVCQPALAIDLSTVFELAKQKDAAILAAQAAAVSKRESLPQARSQMFPNIAFTQSRSKNRLSATTSNFLGEPTTTQDGYVSGNTALTLRQPLYRPAIKLGVDQAGYTVKDADATLDSEYQNLGNKVVGAYFDTLFAIDHLRLIATQKTFLLAQVDSAKRTFAAGSGTRTDIDEAQARLDLTLAQELEANQNVDYKRRQLEALIQQPVDKLAELSPSLLNMSMDVRDLQTWIDTAEAQSPDIRALSARVEAARIDIAKAKTGHLPTLDGSLQWSLSKSENLTSITSRYNTKAVGIQLNVPIYSGGYVSSQVRQAMAELERQEQTLEGARRDLRGRVYTEYRGITEGALKIKAQEQAVRSAAQLVTSATMSKAAGVRTQIDVLNAEQQRSKAEEDLSFARYSYILSLVKLWAMTGEADATQIARINAWLNVQ